MRSSSVQVCTVQNAVTSRGSSSCNSSGYCARTPASYSTSRNTRPFTSASSCVYTSSDGIAFTSSTTARPTRSRSTSAPYNPKQRGGYRCRNECASKSKRALCRTAPPTPRNTRYRDVSISRRIRARRSFGCICAIAPMKYSPCVPNTSNISLSVRFRGCASSGSNYSYGCVFTAVLVKCICALPRSPSTGSR